jgi:hypothetical protein
MKIYQKKNGRKKISKIWEKIKRAIKEFWKWLRKPGEYSGIRV